MINPIQNKKSTQTKQGNTGDSKMTTQETSPDIMRGNTGFKIRAEEHERHLKYSTVEKES